MSTSIHPLTCRCTLHADLAARRHACYRQLARTILGPGAPDEDFALASALAQHHARLEPLTNISRFRPRRAA